MATFGTIRDNLAAELPGAQPATVDAFALLLADVAAGQLPPERIPARFAARPELAELGRQLAGKQMRVGQLDLAFTDSGYPQPLGGRIDARYAQGPVINPTGLVIQIFQGPPPPPPPVLSAFVGYAPGDQPAAEAARALEAALRAAGFEVLLPPVQSSVLRSWRDDLYTVTGLAHAGILVLSAAGLAAGETAMMADLLSLRTLIEPDPFDFIPVLLGPITPADLAASPLAAALAFAAQKTVQGTDTAALAEQVLEKLAWLQKRANPTPRLQALGRSVGELLNQGSVTGDILRTIAEEILQRRLEASPEPYVQVALALWNTEPRSARRTIKYLLNSLQLAKLQELKKSIRSGWIDPCTARCVPLATRREPARRAVVINTDNLDVAESVLLRAYCVLAGSWKLASVTMSSDGLGSSGADLQAKARAALVEAFFGTSRDPRKPGPDDKRLRNLIANAVDEDPVFLVLPSPLPTPAEVSQLLGTSLFEGVTFLFLTDYPPDQHTIQEYPDLLFLQPPLDAALVDEALITYALA